jgi:hypothetical protein
VQDSLNLCMHCCSRGWNPLANVWDILSMTANGGPSTGAAAPRIVVRRNSYFAAYFTTYSACTTSNVFVTHRANTMTIHYSTKAELIINRT